MSPVVTVHDDPPPPLIAIETVHWFSVNVRFFNVQQIGCAFDFLILRLDSKSGWRVPVTLNSVVS